MTHNVLGLTDNHQTINKESASQRFAILDVMRFVDTFVQGGS